MQLENAKMLLAGTWIVAMAVVAYMANASSVFSWAVLGGLTVLPVAAMWRFWSVPPETLSESINEARRR